MTAARRRRDRIVYWTVIGLVIGALVAMAFKYAPAIGIGVGVAAVFGLGEQFADNVQEHARTAEERRP